MSRNRLIELIQIVEPRGIIIRDAMDAAHAQIDKHFGRALTIRQVDAGSCNGCELEIGALHNPYYNLEGLGIHFVASPRHADVLMVTGPVSKAMVVAVQRTFAAMPRPCWVLAVGDCPRDGGVFAGSYATTRGLAEVIPVDAWVPGCPPAPFAVIDALLTLMGKERIGDY